MRGGSLRSRQGRHRVMAAAIALLVVALDQLSKLLVLRTLGPDQVAPLVPGLLRLELVFNTGAAFSLFSGATSLLAVISLAVALGTAVWIAVAPPLRFWPALGAGLLLGGAVGNGLDRWRLGSVVDFLAFVPVRFPVFNFADVAINLAVLCFALDLLRPHADRRA